MTAISKLKIETKKKRQISLITNQHKIVNTKVNNEVTLERFAPKHFSDWLKYVCLFVLLARFLENCRLLWTDKRYGVLKDGNVNIGYFENPH